MNRRFLIGTGFVRNAKTPIPANDFYMVWLKNTIPVNPTKIFVVGAAGAVPDVPPGDKVTYFKCHGDLGHIRDKHEGRTNYPFTGWAGGMMLAALAAYNECLDFIYKEQDCLAFGNWAEQLYLDMGDGGAALGNRLNPPHRLNSSQSLFIVRHREIPDFVSNYIFAGPDKAMGAQTGENKFRRMMEELPGTYKEQSGWNLDRNRPLYYRKGEPWAAQQITPQEFDTLKKLNFI